MSEENENGNHPATDPRSLAELGREPDGDVKRERLINAALTDAFQPGASDEVQHYDDPPESDEGVSAELAREADEALAQGDVDRSFELRMQAARGVRSDEEAERLVQPRGEQDAPSGNATARAVQDITNREPDRHEKMNQHIAEELRDMWPQDGDGEDEGSDTTPHEERLKGAAEFYNKLHSDGPRE